MKKQNNKIDLLQKQPNLVITRNGFDIIVD